MPTFASDKQTRCVGSIFLGGAAVALLVLFFFPARAVASTLLLNPTSGSFAVGSTVSLDVLVDTAGEDVNAISGKILFPTTLLSPVSTRTDDSVVDIWIQEPGRAKDDAVVFEGLILNPGFSGKAKVLSVSFKVLAPGEADVSFASGAVLANDGRGTNTLSQLGTATFTFSGKPVTSSIKKTTPLPFDPNELLVSTLRPPVVTNFTQTPKSLREFAVQGVTYPNADVKLWLRQKNGEPVEYVFSADDAGNFSYRHASDADTNMLPTASVLQGLSQTLQGIPYQFWLAATLESTDSPPTQAFDIAIGGFGIPELLLIIIILLIIGVVLLLTFEMVLLRRMYAHEEETMQHNGRGSQS